MLLTADGWGIIVWKTSEPQWGIILYLLEQLLPMRLQLTSIGDDM